jgi:FkbM family methyltransferase
MSGTNILGRKPGPSPPRLLFGPCRMRKSLCPENWVSYGNRMTWAKRGKVALFGLVVPAALVVCLAFAWAVWRDPAKRVVDFLRFRNHWSGGFMRLAALPRQWEDSLRERGILRFERANFEVEPGVVLTLDPNDIVVRGLLVGDWENTEWSWIAPHLPSGGTFVDVGAHVGIYTIRAAKTVGPQGRVIAVEPNPSTLNDLRHNIAAYGFKNVTVQPVACGDKRTKLKLFAGPATNSGMTSLSEKNAQTSSTSWEVDVVPLDDLIVAEGLIRLDALKIDTEGAETLVLRGARNTIKRFGPIVQVETVEQQLRNMGSSIYELEEILASLGYAKVTSNSRNALWAPAKK